MPDAVGPRPVLDELSRLVEEQPAGSRLPAERDLARRLQVGRAVLRHALHDLADAGRIVTKPQSGSYVR